MKEKENLIYHYTSIDGLIGIIESKSIWASNILYLNDASELNYAKNMFKEEIQRFCKENKNFKKTKDINESLGAIFYEILGENIDSLLGTEVLSFYACSFSEKKDVLSQWRGYCHDSTGYSVGFDINKLKACVDRASIKLNPCIYNEEKQTKSLRTLIDKTSIQFIRKIAKSSNISEAWDNKTKSLAVDFMTEFIQLAPTYKDPQFKEEREWRVIAGFQTQKILKAIKFRPGKSLIIPYIEIPLPTVYGRLAIDQIVIGPTNDKLLSQNSVETLLKSRDVECKDICCSTIPYRQE